MLAMSLCIPPTIHSLYKILIDSIPALFCSEEEKGWLRERLQDWAQTHPRMTMKQ